MINLLKELNILKVLKLVLMTLYILRVQKKKPIYFIIRYKAFLDEKNKDLFR